MSSPIERSKTVGSSGLQTVSRAAEVLAAFLLREEWGVSMLSRHLGYSKSMVHRIATTLAHHGLLEFDARTSNYRIGPLIGALAQNGLREQQLIAIARPFLAEACAITAETVSLAELDGNEGLCIDFAESPQAMKMTFYRGEKFALNAGAIGKGLLAFQPDDFIERYIGSAVFERYTENTILDADSLRAEIGRIRQTGVAFSDSEITPGAASVCVPVFETDGTACLVVAVSGPSSRFTKDRMHETAAMLKGLSARLSEAIGFQRSGKIERKALRAV